MAILCVIRLFSANVFLLRSREEASIKDDVESAAFCDDVADGPLRKSWMPCWMVNNSEVLRFCEGDSVLSWVRDVIETTAVGDSGGESFPPRPCRSARSKAKRFLTEESASRRCSADSCPEATGVRMVDSILVAATASIVGESAAREFANTSFFGTGSTGRESGPIESDASAFTDASW